MELKMLYFIPTL